MLPIPKEIDYLEIVTPRRSFVLRKVCKYFTEGKILDVGCGNGRTTRFFGKFGYNILGIDVDAREIRRAVDANEYENVKFDCLNINDIIDESFSEILLIEVLEHVDDPFTFLKEIHRLCKNDGFLILTIPNGRSLKEILMLGVRILKKHSFIFTNFVQWYRKILSRDKAFNESPHVQLFTLKRIRSVIGESGFYVQEEFYCDLWSGFFWMFFSWIPMPFFSA